MSSLTTPLVKINMFGGLNLEADGKRFDRFRSQKAVGLLAYVAYFPRLHAREALLELLWPDCDEDTGRNRLSTALWLLGRDLEPLGLSRPQVIRADRALVGINPETVQTDVGQFEGAQRALAAEPDVEKRPLWLERAAALYTGELLPGLYADWLAPEQLRLSTAFERIALALADARERAGNLEGAIQAVERAMRSEPLSAAPRLNCMRLHALTGRPDVALAQFRDYRALVRRELGREPAPDLIAMAEAIQSNRELASFRRVPQPGVPVIRTDDSVPTESPAVRTTPRTPVTPSGHPGGALPPDAGLYVTRAADAAVRDALEARESIVLIKGARQVGKSSLLARAARDSRGLGRRVAILPLQVLQRSQTESVDGFLETLAGSLALSLELPVPAHGGWAGLGGNFGLWRYLQDVVLREDLPPLVWCLDDVDRLFGLPFGEEVFALIRSWHNERAFHPSSPWGRLTIVMAYATEAYLFVRNIHQSPFNIGARVDVLDFDLQQFEGLNRHYGSPVPQAEVRAMHQYLGGHPYLCHQALHALSGGQVDLPSLRDSAASEAGPFGDHLRTLRAVLDADPDLLDAAMSLAQGKTRLPMGFFHRLRSAGVASGPAESQARLRCGLYGEYLRRMAAPG